MTGKAKCTIMIVAPMSTKHSAVRITCILEFFSSDARVSSTLVPPYINPIIIVGSSSVSPSFWLRGKKFLFMASSELSKYPAPTIKKKKKAIV